MAGQCRARARNGLTTSAPATDDGASTTGIRTSGCGATPPSRSAGCVRGRIARHGKPAGPMVGPAKRRPAEARVRLLSQRFFQKVQRSAGGIPVAETDRRAHTHTPQMPLRPWRQAWAKRRLAERARGCRRARVPRSRTVREERCAAPPEGIRLETVLGSARRGYALHGAAWLPGTSRPLVAGQRPGVDVPGRPYAAATVQGGRRKS